MSEVKTVYAHSISEYRHFAKSFIGAMQGIVKGNITQAKAAMDELLLHSGAMTPEEAPGDVDYSLEISLVLKRIHEDLALVGHLHDEMMASRESNKKK